VRVTQKWTKKDGERVHVEKKQRVSPWWRLGPVMRRAFA
jgi:hypothetical protein